MFRNKKRNGFTLAELVMVMVIIAILATGLILGFSTYINKSHETGVTADFKASFQNPLRTAAVEKGITQKPDALKADLIENGFSAYSAGDWRVAVTESATLTAVADGITFGVEKGNKRYQVIYKTGLVEGTAVGGFDKDLNNDGDKTDTVTGIIVRADHSSKYSTAIYTLNEPSNDIVITTGTCTDGDVTKFVAD